MSYRIYLERPDGKFFQLFGNNECPRRFIKYLKKYGCDVDEEDFFEHFEVVNFNEFFGTIESFIQEEIKNSQQDMFSSQNRYKNTIEWNIRNRDNAEIFECQTPITYSVYSFLSDAYVFEGYRVLQFLEDYLEYSFDKTLTMLYFGEKIKLKADCQLYLSGG